MPSSPASELVRHRVAHVAAVGLHGRRLEAAAREDSLVGVVHRPVALVRAGGVHVEGVGVLHDELLRAHEAEARTRLVAELRLDLIDNHRQLAVGADDGLDDVRHLLFGGRAEREVVLGAVLELEHVRAHRLPAPRGLPQFGGLENRHEQFLRARAVHLLAHDRLDLAQRPHAEGQEREQPGGRLLDDRRPDEQLVRVDFSVPRVFPEGLDHHLGPLHCFFSKSG